MPLSTYTASAGSGKTYALTREYLRILLSQPSATNVYTQLLAVTFTNKAAGEMKQRIMERLDSMASSTDEQPAADEKEFCSTLSIAPTELRRRALAVRSAILHNYSYFSVSTIDTFFQKIVRSFLREMGLSATFELELDSDRILDEAVDALWQDAATNDSLRERLITLANQRISNGKSWNAREQLKSIGAEIFKESFYSYGKEFLDKIGNSEFLNNYEKQLRAIVTGFTNTMRDTGVRALDLLKENDFATTDFKYKTSSFANYFNKIINPADDKDYLPGKRTLEALHDEEKWLTGNVQKDEIVRTIIFPVVNPLLEKACMCYEQQFPAYRTAREILKNLYSMALLADVAAKVTEVSNTKNSLLIIDTLRLLHTLIGDSDAPFIFEKAGVYYRSFMLDEFQDTSKTQWEVLRPLLLNGLSENGEVLAVGDVKQSIYRWRNGDWRILAQGIYDYFKAYKANRMVLDTNWRSREVIVDTNNLLFKQLPMLLQQKLTDSIDEAGLPASERLAKLRTTISEAYITTEQKVSPAKSGSGGYVHIESVVASGEEESSAKEEAIKKLIAQIISLQERGYRASDIAILTRKRREGQEIAEALLQYKHSLGDTPYCFDVVSQDSLFLANAPVVQFVIALLRVAVDTSDDISKAIAERYLQRFVPGKQITNRLLSELLYLPLIEAVEKITTTFQLNENPSNWLFLQELHDVMLAYTSREQSDIYSFLQHWNDMKGKCTLPMTGNAEAIQILSIHKSKGLQFPVVIIPFCNWSLEPKTNSLLWVKAEQEPFSGPGYLPLNYTGALSGTYFYEDYWEEQAQSAIDNLNLLYVAFTRAEDELYAFVPQSKLKRKNNFSTILPELLQTDIYSVGTQIDKKEKQKPEEESLALQSYPTQPYTNKLRVKYSNAPMTDIHAAGMRDYGVLMHQAFSYINTPADIDNAIARLVEEGLLANESTQYAMLKNLIEQALTQKGVQSWFDGSWQLLNETNLLLPSVSGTGVQQLRPDRVMRRNNEVVVVDYKFGKNKLQQYTEQVRNYISLIKQMGFANVTGYCWYISLEQVEPVSVNVEL